ncbi:MAG: urease accessory protein UreD [Roseinatronobacter sp.]
MVALTDLDVHQRAKGRTHAAFARTARGPVLRDLYQQGSAKVIILPGPEAVFLNTSGGLTGGDRLSYSATIGPGVYLTATTQTAERAYRSQSGQAQLGVSFEVGAGAHLDWLPQETILFDRANLRRRTVITLGAGASCLMAESVVLGRAAMGETVQRLDFHDWREVRRGDTPLHLEALTLSDARLRSQAAGLAGMRAFASVVLVAEGAADKLDAVRAALDNPDVRGAASALPGRLMLRLMAPDGWPLRQQMVRALNVLRHRPLPRVWQC